MSLACTVQRFGSPAADLNKTRLHKITFSIAWAATVLRRRRLGAAGVGRRSDFFFLKDRIVYLIKQLMIPYLDFITHLL
jgi:hypothetical protein